MRLRTIALLLAFVITLLGVSTVQAVQAATGIGTVSVTSSHMVSTRHVGHNVLNVVNNTFMVTGALSGTASGLERDLIHTRRGNGIATGHVLFTGTLAGMSGTLQVRYHSHLVNGAITGHFTIHDGTGQLAGVKGHGTFHGTMTAPLSYTLTWHMSGHSDSRDE